MELMNGCIDVLNNKIFHNITEAEFVELFCEFIEGSPSIYRFTKLILLDGVEFSALVLFHNNVISRIILSKADELFKNSYSNWSTERMYAKKKSHEEWLINQLGEPHINTQTIFKYTFSWGEISSDYDPRSGSVEILIVYKVGE